MQSKKHCLNGSLSSGLRPNFFLTGFYEQLVKVFKRPLRTPENGLRNDLRKELEKCKTI